MGSRIPPKPLGAFGSEQAAPEVLQALPRAMDAPCANGKLQKGPAQGGWRYLAVLAAVPPGALGSLSQLASGGVAAAVRALL